jgi:hypothetical protein
MHEVDHNACDYLAHLARRYTRQEDCPLVRCFRCGLSAEEIERMNSTANTTTYDYVRQDDGSYEMVIKAEQPVVTVETVVISTKELPGESYPGQLHELDILNDYEECGHRPEMPARFEKFFRPSDIEDFIKGLIDDTDHDNELQWALMFKHAQIEDIGYDSWSYDYPHYYGPDTDWEEVAQEYASDSDGVDEESNAWSYINWEAWGIDIRVCDYSRMETPDGTEVYRNDNW